MALEPGDKLPVCPECSIIFNTTTELYVHFKCPFALGEVVQETSSYEKLIKILLDNPNKTAQEIIVMIVKEAKL